ncbi:VanZ family protein [Arthrobacter glacialis]|uniref:VanZ family protein n=1 Tax=Arthrobacter glacialis TaxID=1664 RepID=A0A2S4A0C2_ARTGL|nr:VanZ family protein [Arthrobacter glacialis]POH74913.1 VanZ family protein [Arthrobacter glacialis]
MTSTHQALHRLAVSLMAAYLVALSLIVFWPTPVDQPAAGVLHQVIDWLHRHGMPAFIDYAQIEFSANVLLFVPMGIIASVWTKKAWLGLGIGFVTSCTIELGQSLFLAARFPSVLDVLANTLGAGVGAAIYTLAHRRSLVEAVETQEGKSGS